MARGIGSILNLTKLKRFRAPAALALLAAAAWLLPALGSGSQASAQSAPSAPPNAITFQMFPAAKFIPCMAARPGITPTVRVSVVRGRLNDRMTVMLQGFKPGLQFDLFTVENSNQNADGTPVQGFSTFGMAWYQTDVQPGVVTINTILLDQIFGFDPLVNLKPTNTFHVGMWFNNPADAAPCNNGVEIVTPFNGDHRAGPLAFISRPNALTRLGPLCTNPDLATTPVSCRP